MVQVGKEAPDFTLPATLGDKVTLSQYRGDKTVLLAFHVLDFTPGWTSEIASFQLARKGFEEANTQVLGVSVDSVFSHKAYAASFGNLWFPLLADFHPKGKVAESYGVMQHDKGMSKRSCFIIDKKGILRHQEVYEPGKLPNADQLLEKIRAL